MKSGANKTPLKIALLGTYTIDLIGDYLDAELSQRNFQVDYYVGGFGQLDQEVMQPASGLNQFHPQVVIFYLDGQDLFKDLIARPLECTESRRKKTVAERLEHITSLVKQVLSSHSAAHVLVTNVSVPGQTALGLLEGNSEWSVDAIAREFNSGLESFSRSTKQVSVINQDAAASRLGRDQWFDDRMRFTAAIPFSDEAMKSLARDTALTISALHGHRRKCLVLDCDNTLWGGVIGEDGVEGIKLSPEGPGQAFYELQQTVQSLRDQGIILAISSKNNREDALEAIDHHPFMLLRSKDFATMKIDWNDKAGHLRAIARELNIGLDALVVLDDSAQERELMRQQVPDVLVIDLPDDAAFFRRALLDSGAFPTLKLTAEDRSKGARYQEQAAREELKSGATSLEDYFRSLKMKAVIAKASPVTVARIAQLTQKTNQFNVTTRRYQESDIEKLMKSKDAAVYSLQLVDKFGDNGLVGVIILKQQADVATIDTFLLSCRVIGRTAEHAFLAQVMQDAKKRGVKKIVGEYLPTAKNPQVKTLYSQLGFKPQAGSDNRWAFDLEKETLKTPEWIESTFA